MKPHLDLNTGGKEARVGKGLELQPKTNPCALPKPCFASSVEGTRRSQDNYNRKTHKLEKLGLTLIRMQSRT